MIKLCGVGRSVKRTAVGLALVTLVMAKVSVASAVTAAPFKLAWNPSSSSGVAGYRIYYKMAGSSTEASLDAGPVTSATLSGFTSGTNYLLYVAAYDASGNESPRSNGILYNPPAVTRIGLSKTTANTMQLQFRSAEGSRCRIEYSPTLKPTQWQPLTTATADTNGNITVTDPLTGRPPTRFYRAVRL